MTAPTDHPPGRHRPHRWRTALVVATSAAAFAAAVVVWDEWRAGDPPAPELATHTHPTGVFATTAATASAAGAFAGTPAAGWPSGQAGIALPAGRATGPFSADQVDHALAQVAGALVAARVAPEMVTGGDPEPFVSLLAPQLRDQVREELRSGESRVYATRLAADAALAEAQPRVRGRVTYREGTDPDGVTTLEIITNFVWAYAFAPGSGGDQVVVVHDELVWHVPHPDQVAEPAEGLWLADGLAYAGNVDCDAYQAGLLQPGPALPAEPAAPAEQAGRGDAALFDPDHPLELTTAC